MKSKHFLIEFPALSHYVVHVEISSDIKKSLLKYPPTKSIEMEENTHGLAVHTDNAFSYIFLPYDTSAGDIAHEAWHVIRHMMEYLSIELDNEAVAYHLGYMVNKIFRFLRGRK
jgi:hypothetical protein